MKFCVIKICLLTVLVVTSGNAFAGEDSSNLVYVEARAFVSAAENAQAGVFAPVYLKLAKENLLKAKNFRSGSDWDDAEAAATRAKVDAMLAASKVRQVKSEKSLLELRKVVETLRAELQRRMQ